MNVVLTPARKFVEIFMQKAAEGAQSERLTAIGVMCRGPGVTRRPAAV
jgi:hypothetical protein